MIPEERRWIRYLAGELAVEERRRLESRLRQDPTLARRFERYEEVWRQLEGPPSAEPETGMPTRVMAAARQRVEPLSWRRAPWWARVGAAAALVLGMTLGSVASAREGSRATAEPPILEEEIWYLAPGPAADDWTFLQDGLWLDEMPVTAASPLETEGGGAP